MEVSTDFKFRKVHDKFKSDPNEKSYNKLIVFLRNVLEKNKINISKDYTLIYFDDDNQPIFNSFLQDNKLGNSFQNYVNKKISFNNKYQKISANKANSDIINVTSVTKKICENKYNKFLYTSNFIGSGIVSAENVESSSRICIGTKHGTSKYHHICI